MSDPGLNGFPIKRIPPSHDYIRRDGAGPKDGWARGPADPGPGPAAAGAVTPTEDVPATPGTAPGDHLSPPKDDGISPPFVHLHVHSNFSFLDGGSRIAELVDRAVELGQPALALTDHDGLYGAIRFAKACIRRGLQPIFGAEVCVESLAGEPRGPYHLVLLAETREGYANLCRLVSAAHLAIPERDRPPTLTAAQLREHHEGIICLTGCRQGEVGRLVDAGREAEALHVLEVLRDIFGPEHLFVELQYFAYRPQREVEAGQDGAPVYHKVRGDNGRLRHFRDDGHPTGRDAPGGNSDTRATRDPGSLRSGVGPGPGPDSGSGRSGVRTQPRSDLPSGRPQRLDSADFDVGFHPEGAPWSLACLTYCDRLLQLARQCGLPAVLTTDAHYARPEDRPVHLVCRAAGRDEPLSGYPTSEPGVRCLRPRAELEAELQPLIELHCSC